MTWRNEFIPKNKYTRPGTLLKEVRKIVLHWTANPGAPAKNHVKYFGVTLPAQSKALEQQGKKYTAASAHIFVDRNESVCIIPLNEVAYHANDVHKRNDDGSAYRGVKEIAPNANLYSLGYETCVEEDGTIHQDTINRAIADIAALCITYKLTEEDIVRHFDVTAKDCPSPFIKEPVKFEDFKKQVGLILNPPKPEEKPEERPEERPEVKPVVTPKPPVYPGKLIRKGDRNSNVKLIQAKLGIKDDGIFGAITDKTVRDFQKKNKLTVDGKVGPKTWTKLFN
ncbi:N-acetylmuramoyl-L-alanine amidase [Bacillus sp. UNCCL81]|uniref:peptidoglycan recognition protein family protein n=1 Tax=Bacillus sp. UNCCL81 TaxID=1502755 RepID=UPI0008E82926|nr:N-acetylmuramoyl-L-alanine amidase [Bacillus sp. UNCCL81]SFD43866.1 Putative peptidoglycan binding domain-containing protein [Bacillus sp. UNCCL81]